MDINGIDISNEMVMAFLGLVVFGFCYNLGIEKWPWLAELRPAEQVVVGVIITVTVSSFFIGWEHATIVFFMFAGSGLFMLIGSWARASRDAREAKQITKETLK